MLNIYHPTSDKRENHFQIVKGLSRPKILPAILNIYYIYTFMLVLHYKIMLKLHIYAKYL